MDRTTSQDGEGVATVGRDDVVLVGDGGFHTNGNGFLKVGSMLAYSQTWVKRGDSPDRSPSDRNLGSAWPCTMHQLPAPFASFEPAIRRIEMLAFQITLRFLANLDDEPSACTSQPSDPW